MTSEVLKVLTYNIHKGFNVGNRDFILQNIKSAVQASGADVVFLQEVQGEHRKKQNKIDAWPKVSQFEFIADQIWHHYAYGKNATHSKGHHGNAILSKYPIVFSENINITTNRFAKRGILHAILKKPNTDERIHLLCMHLDLFEYSRNAQIEKLTRHVLKNTHAREPIIVAGDFNDWRKRTDPILREKLGLKEVFVTLFGENERTFPSFMPLLCLDRIYYKGIKPLAAGCFTGHPWHDLSDHLALYAHFSWEHGDGEA